MTERQLQEFIEELNTYGSVLGLANMKELLVRMGNPEKQCKVIHIAGTNGKGSVLAYVSSVLTKAGYKTGRYLSPVIYEYREKIQLNGRPIPKKALTEGMELIKDCIFDMKQEGLTSPTLFEAETALAFWYFAKMDCDFVVLETGLGGAKDATNVIKDPVACVITPISMDHMAILGKTLEAIAAVKCGIIKPGAAVISAQQSPEVMEVISKKCKEMGCVLKRAGMPEKVTYGLEKQSFSYGIYKKIQISMAGVWQPENACTALEVLNALKEKGYDIPMEAICEGMKETRWDGRFSVLRKKPLFIIDGAHNEAAALCLRESIKLYLTGKRLIFIIGVLKDKEYDKILEHTVDLAQHIITVTPPENSRALSAYELAREAEKYHNSVTTADSLEEAVEIASLLGGGECAMIAFGSLSYLGRLTKVVEAQDRRRAGKRKSEIKDRKG